MEDHEIVALYWDRKEEAIAETDRKYGAYCSNVAYGILRSREDSAECVSDTWLRAWNTMPPQRPRKLGAYLTKIVRNLSLDRYRRHHALRRGGGQLTAVYEELEEVIPTAPAGESLADSLAIRDSLERYLEQLELRQRQVFLLRYWYAHTPSEIGSQLGMTRQQVNSMLFGLRKRLKAHLEQEGIWL